MAGQPTRPPLHLLNPHVEFLSQISLRYLLKQLRTFLICFSNMTSGQCLKNLISSIVFSCTFLKQMKCIFATRKFLEYMMGETRLCVHQKLQTRLIGKDVTFKLRFTHSRVMLICTKFTKISLFKNIKEMCHLKYLKLKRTANPLRTKKWIHYIGLPCGELCSLFCCVGLSPFSRV